MITHIMVEVADVERSAAFFNSVLATLAATPLMEVRENGNGRLTTVGFGDASGPFFWIKSGTGTAGYCHVAFSAPTRAAVRSFYETAIAAGGRDNGKPGLRPQYHSDYYAAFVIDPDGNNIEAACLDGGD